MTFYCPVCWSTVGRAVTVCPTCGADLSRESARPFVDRLVSALRHPLRENRMIAIEILGDLRADVAVSPLSALLGGKADFYEARAAISTLAKIGSNTALAALEETAVADPSPLVRKCATRALGDFRARDVLAAKHHGVRPP